MTTATKTKYYEIVLLIHPDHSDKIAEVMARHKSNFEEAGAKVHRAEDWGRMRLAYEIKRKYKAHYLFYHLEGDIEVIEQFKEAMKYNNAILRYFIESTKYILSDKSPLYKSPEDEDKSEKHRTFVKPHDLEKFNYKNIRLLKESMMETGRIVPARTTGRTAQQQRWISRAIKVARFLALLPYCDRHR